ncbi:MAG: hypothetical protein UZ18_ATM001000261 [Armatimonadetes bacterium OLB18]|nr:MAG: hypothetical protein UZ18_ATM001000261 [Armatimonadetes bacterium OLB18]
MLNPEIREFIESLRQLPAVGCVLSPAKSLSRIAALLGQEISCLQVDSARSLPTVKAPALLLASEEDYSNHPDWAEKLRGLAGYFLNLE